MPNGVLHVVVEHLRRGRVDVVPIVGERGSGELGADLAVRRERVVGLPGLQREWEVEHRGQIVVDDDLAPHDPLVRHECCSWAAIEMRGQIAPPVVLRSDLRERADREPSGEPVALVEDSGDVLGSRKEGEAVLGQRCRRPELATGR